jgi:glycosyltransferase involved in cell wall biosynthesis
MLVNEAIQSIINQTYRPIECIVVDDGSIDNTKELIRELMKKNDNSFTLKYISQNNSGAQVARNTGTAISTGEYLQYLDSDDLLYAEKIEKQVAFLEENQNCDAVWGGWRKGQLEKNELIEFVSKKDLLTQLLTEGCIVNFSVLMRRALVQKIGRWDVNLRRNQEIDFQVRGLLEGADYEYQPQTCGLWRVHGGERIANTTGIKEILAFYEKWEPLLISKSLFNDQIKKNIANVYFYYVWYHYNKIDKNGMKMLAEAIRLNPEISFANSKKMKLFLKFLPFNFSIRFWFAYAKMRTKQ